MSRSRVRRGGLLRVGAAALLLCGGAGLSGCSSMIGDHLPQAAGGLPQDAPDRATVQPAYPAVHDMPPTRSASTLSDDERKRIEGDLIAARNRVGTNPDATAAPATAANPTAGTAKKP